MRRNFATALLVAALGIAGCERVESPAPLSASDKLPTFSDVQAGLKKAPPKARDLCPTPLELFLGEYVLDVSRKKYSGSYNIGGTRRAIEVCTYSESFAAGISYSPASNQERLPTPLTDLAVTTSADNSYLAKNEINRVDEILKDRARLLRKDGSIFVQTSQRGFRGVFPSTIRSVRGELVGVRCSRGYFDTNPFTCEVSYEIEDGIKLSYNYLAGYENIDERRFPSPQDLGQHVKERPPFPDPAKVDAIAHQFLVETLPCRNCTNWAGSGPK